MKFLVSIYAFLLVMVISPFALAQGVPPADDGLVKFLLDLVAKFPVLATVLLVIGILRAINKPLFTLLRAFADSTPSSRDNLLLDEVEASKAYKSVSYILDWFGSVKLPGSK